MSFIVWLHYMGHYHTTDGPPTIGPPGPSAAAMDGPPRNMHGCHTWSRGDHLQHLASPQLIPHSHGWSPTAGPFTGVAAGSVAKYT